MGIRPELLDREPKPYSARELRVIGVLAEKLAIPAEKILRRSTLTEDLRIDAKRRDWIRQALQDQCGVDLSSETFDGLRTVGDVMDCVEKAADVEPRVIKVIAGELQISEGPLRRETSLVDDLKVTPAQRSGLRKELSKVFRIFIPWKKFLEFRTIGEVVDYVDKIVKLREAAKQPKEPPVPPSPVTRGVRPGPPPTSLGIRPGPPPPGSFGGIRPGPPPPPRRPSPLEQAEEMRRRAKEFRRRMRGGQ